MGAGGMAVTQGQRWRQIRELVSLSCPEEGTKALVSHPKNHTPTPTLLPG